MDVGDIVEDFELVDDRGVPRHLSEFVARGPVVLFFYPAAMTAGCTAESCHFQDLQSEFAALGASCVGISQDPVDKQRQFSDKHHFGYPLLSDEDGAVARRFGVRRSNRLLHTRRWTFVIGEDSRVRAIVKSEFSMRRHADRALEVLRGGSTFAPTPS